MTTLATRRLQPLPSRIESKIDKVLLGWIGTRYRLGSRTKGKFVDCLNFATAFLDEMSGRPTPPPVRQLRGDACLHSEESCRAAMRTILRSYSPYQEVVDGSLEPGDIIVEGPEDGGPGHVLIASTAENVAVHTGTYKVCPRSVQPPPGRKVFAVYRYMRKLSEW